MSTPSDQDTHSLLSLPQPDSASLGMDEAFDHFLEWTLDKGIELYPAQEEAIIEVMSDRHVILNTPTGSGKSLVGQAAHFWALLQGKRSIYTSPIKALVNEKFFSLCNQFGPENVGMLTGDASINRDALILCCTQEILATLALSEGDSGYLHYAVIDEFHYYGDRDRGMAWQIPLLALTQTRFLLMSATLGDTTELQNQLEEQTNIPVSLVQSTTRPVPLHFEYKVDPLHETIPDLVKKNQAPIYIVSFTQNGCASIAQSLVSLNLCSREEKALIQKEIKGTRLDSPYGNDIKRFLMAGVGLHHAGLLPKYRLLIERLAQAGVLKVICGTDTLGVGINVPIRTVIFNELSKFDGQKHRLLTVRDFKQIAGRAGRKGFDDEGFVICQAPEYAIENQTLRRKIEASSKKKKVKFKSPPSDRANWDENKFNQLIERPSETLIPRFSVDYDLILNVFQSPYLQAQKGGGYGGLVRIIRKTPLSKKQHRDLLLKAKQHFQALFKAGVIEWSTDQDGPDLVIGEDLQDNFSMHHPLSLYLLHTLGALPPDHEDYELQIVSLVESILEDPLPILYKQQNEARKEKIAELKAQGMEFEERKEEVEKISWPQPEEDWIRETYEVYAQKRPWLYAHPVRPKSVIRDMYSRCATFKDYVQLYQLKTYEGGILRYLNQAYKALSQNIPEVCKTEALHDLIAYLRATLRRADSSLLEAWVHMRHGDKAVERLNQKLQKAEQALVLERQDLTEDPKAFFARIRAQMRAFVQALSRCDYEEALLHIRFAYEDGGENLIRPSGLEEPFHMPQIPFWSSIDLEEALAPFYNEYEEILFNAEARANHNTVITPNGPRKWTVRHTLLDDQLDRLWYVYGEIDLNQQETPEGPLVSLIRIGV